MGLYKKLVDGNFSLLVVKVVLSPQSCLLVLQKKKCAK